MHPLLKQRRAQRRLTAQQLASIFQHTLSCGVDMDRRGLHWKLPAAIPAEQRLAFALAVYFTGGLHVLIDADRGFLCVERIAQRYAQLQTERKADSYRIGHAYGLLHEALGYAQQGSEGFHLIQDADLHCPERFVAGFSDSMAESLEGDVMRIVRGGAAEDDRGLIDHLRRFIANRLSVVAAANDAAVAHNVV